MASINHIKFILVQRVVNVPKAPRRVLAQPSYAFACHAVLSRRSFGADGSLVRRWVRCFLVQTKTPSPRNFGAGRFELSYTRQITADSEVETVVVLMSADPKPAHYVTFA